MSKANYIPQAIFDNVEYLKLSKLPPHVSDRFDTDYNHAKQFLLSYQHNAETFKSFRREIERYAQYCWFIANKSMLDMCRSDIENYLSYCQNPPITWISNKNVVRFKMKNGLRISNKNWRPFVVSVSKSQRHLGIKPKRNQYKLSEKSFREIFTILNCYYNFLIQEEISEINPIIQVKQKSRFYRSTQGKAKVRRVSQLQWQTIIEIAEAMAARNPEKHERTLFIFSALYGMYLRISELTVSERWTPTMNDFEKDHDDHWWFTTVSKGNKERRIAVSQSMLAALSRWRSHLGLSPSLPLPSDNSPLIPKIIGHGGVSDTSHVRRIVQDCFDEAIASLRQRGLENDAQELSQATVHWLRHTGISDDVKVRPREHVRDDAGHSSSSITDRYIDINLRERHASAVYKSINHSAKDSIDSLESPSTGIVE